MIINMPNVPQKLEVLSNLNLVMQKIRSACEKTGKDYKSVDLLAVTKYAKTNDVKTLVEKSAIKFIGESRLQDSLSKWKNGELSSLRESVTMHFIGHIQSNKIKKICDLFDSINSVDNVKTAEQIDRHSYSLGKKMPIMLQINLTGSSVQSGTKLKEASNLLKEVRKFQNIEPRGYMAIAPIVENAEELRPIFKEVKKVFDKDFPQEQSNYGQKNYLSLGMSEDFYIAIEEGSNLPRIGSLIFQPIGR
ncbi:MAG: YggS family pyridoxal phosphate-dependent enzyme [Elusimicrobia bacterium]|nr:YggS family pyridoxal phosphate-dependent enzyme [Elusimicrobiota bacterium]